MSTKEQIDQAINSLNEAMRALREYGLITETEEEDE